MDRARKWFSQKVRSGRSFGGGEQRGFGAEGRRGQVVDVEFVRVWEDCGEFFGEFRHRGLRVVVIGCVFAGGIATLRFGCAF